MTFRNAERDLPAQAQRRGLRAAQGQGGAAARHERAWHMVMFNCNDFGIAIARELGLAAPPNMLVPNAWVRALKAMNGG